MIRLFNLFNGMVVTVGSLLQSPFLLIIRLFWGYQFFITGKGKLMNLGDVTSYFTELGLPLPKFQAILAGSTECFGGLLLLVGLFSRIVSIPLIVTMVVAYLTTEMDAVKGIFNDPDPFLNAKPFLFLLASLIVFIFGPGAFSVDRWILKRA